MSLCASCPDPGMCCRYIELPLARLLTSDEQRWVELHPGFRMLSPRTIRIDISCSALTAEGLCSLFGQAERPIMCSVWPDDVEHQAPAGCVYLKTFTAQAVGRT